jgi:hypothetical protein
MACQEELDIAPFQGKHEIQNFAPRMTKHVTYA